MNKAFFIFTVFSVIHMEVTWDKFQPLVSGIKAAETQLVLDVFQLDSRLVWRTIW